MTNVTPYQSSLFLSILIRKITKKKKRNNRYHNHSKEEKIKIIDISQVLIKVTHVVRTQRGLRNARQLEGQFKRDRSPEMRIFLTLTLNKGIKKMTNKFAPQKELRHEKKTESCYTSTRNILCSTWWTRQTQSKSAANLTIDTSMGNILHKQS